MTNDEPEQPYPKQEEGVAPSETRPREARASGPLVQIDAKVTGIEKPADLFGLGAAAKTPAGEAVARGIAPSLGLMLASAAEWAFGQKNARTAYERKILEARAVADVDLIKAQGEQRLRSLNQAQSARFAASTRTGLVEADVDRLRIAAGERLIAKEVRRQETIEAVLAEAIALADEADQGAQPSAIPEDLASKIVDAAADSSAPNVRSIYARLIASQVKPSPDRISSPSLSLLESLDGNLASVLESFVRKEKTYGIFPWHLGVHPEIDAHAISILIEIGFLRTVYTTDYHMLSLSIHPKGRGNTSHHGCLAFSVRGQEIADAIYDPTYVAKILNNQPVLKEEYYVDLLSIIGGLNTEASLVSISILSINGDTYEFQIKQKGHIMTLNSFNHSNKKISNANDLKKHNIDFNSSDHDIIEFLTRNFHLEYITSTR